MIAVTVLEMSIIGIFMKTEPHWYVLVYPSLIHPARGILQTMAIFMVVAVATERYGYDFFQKFSVIMHGYIR